MIQSKASPLDRFLMGSTLIFLVWLPLPLGSDRDWSSYLLIMIAALLSALWSVSQLQKTAQNNKALKPALIMVGLLGLTQLWVLTQFLMGWTVDQSRTFDYLLLGCAYTLLFLLIVGLFHTRKRLILLISVLIISGTFQAFYGSLMVLSKIEWLLFMPKERGFGSATGTYVNRNHLAGYLVMTISLGIGLLMALRDGKPMSFRSLLEVFMGSKARLRLAIIIMVIGLVMTTSRMGNTAFFASIILVGAIFVLINKENRLRNSLILVSILIIDLLVISQFFGLERLQNRLAQTEITISTVAGDAKTGQATELIFDVNDLRGVAFRNTITMGQDRPWLGFGAGTYESAFQAYKESSFGPNFHHAHNDFLQFWVEYGLIGFIPLILFGIMAFYYALKALFKQDSWFRSGLGFGSTMALIGMLIHATSEFNLQIPANAATFVCVCAIAVLANFHRKGHTSRSR